MMPKKYKKYGKTHEFIFTKIITFDHDSLRPLRHIASAILYEKKLDQLKKENFNRIKIPNYSVKRTNNIIVIDMQFIKGIQLNKSNKNNYRQIILQDLVLRLDSYGKRKTFHDYALKNFIIEDTTNELYYVDLEHYGEKTLEEQLKKFNLHFGN